MRTAEKEESGVKSLMKCLKASMKKSVCMMVSRRPYKERRCKVSCEAGFAHKSKMKKRKKAGEKVTRWQHNEIKSKNWRKFWNEEV